MAPRPGLEPCHSFSTRRNYRCGRGVGSQEICAGSARRPSPSLALSDTGGRCGFLTGHWPRINAERQLSITTNAYSQPTPAVQGRVCSMAGIKMERSPSMGAAGQQVGLSRFLATARTSGSGGARPRPYSTPPSSVSYPMTSLAYLSTVILRRSMSHVTLVQAACVPNRPRSRRYQLGGK